MPRRALRLQPEVLEDRRLLSGGGTATFLKQDATTQGNWAGTYGAQGYDVLGGASSLPSYATVTPSAQYNWTWAGSTTDPRAPLTSPTAASGVAACWYSPTSFSVNVDLADGQVHDLELYLLDWDSTSRVEQVQVSNAATGAVLSTQTASSFQNGVYLDYAVSGDVQFTFTCEGGANAVLSGLFLDPQAASASFIKQDATTQGNWAGTYGAQGYDVLGGASSLPSYATVTPSAQYNWTWAGSTTDPRAPLTSPTAASGVAACWYSPTNFSVNVDLADGQVHDLELYLLDWDSTSRVEQVQVSNAATGAVLSTQTASSFQNGVYLDYAVSGDVQITFTCQGGANAVLSGLFLDPQGASATFIKQDVSTQGSWAGTYGTQGYDVLGGASSLPSYATITPSGQSDWTWASSPTDPRAPLAAPTASSGVAACWYSPTSFSVDVNLTDGQVHDLALYLLDWDSTSRVEQVQISNAATGAVLSTQTASSFHNGVYLDYAVSGNVQITFTCQGGANAVLSGLFLDPATPTTTAPAPTPTPSPTPTLMSETPGPGATGVGIGMSVAATFNEAISPASITTGGFVLHGPSGTSVSAAVTYNGSTDTVTLTPAATLAASTTYTATVSGAASTSGVPMAAPVTWSFTTDTPPGPPPVVIGEDPAPNSTSVAVTSVLEAILPLTVTFNQAVQPGTIDFSLVDGSGNPVPSTVYYSDATDTATLTPEAVLANGMTYTATVSGAETTAGSPMNSPVSWTFTTAGAVAPPAVISTSPSTNGTSVDVGTPIAVNFNEAVLASSISTSSFTLKDASGNIVPATVTYGDTGALHTATLTPQAALVDSTTYTAMIQGVTDAAGNTLPQSYTWSFTTASGSSTITQLPLVYQSNLQYVGGFRVPNGQIGASQFNYAGQGLAYNPANNSLFAVGYGGNSIAEIGIPNTIVNSGNLTNLATASVLQPFSNIYSRIPNTSNLGDGTWATKGPVDIGGLMVDNGQLIGTEFVNYDTSGTTVATNFRLDSLNLSSAQVEGMFQVGNLGAGFYAGYMGSIPIAWQSALGAPDLIGQGGLNIISRTSYGPAAFGFNPSDLSLSNSAPAVPYVYYPASNPLGAWGSTNPMFNGNTSINGVFFVPNTRTVLFFGSVGTNQYSYGLPGPVNDPYRTGKGNHSLNGDYAYQVWAYDVNDFLAVKQGTMQPWQLQPYATWNLDFPQFNGAKSIGGVAFDPSTDRLYVTQLGADTQAPYSYLPVVQVFQLSLSPPPAISQFALQATVSVPSDVPGTQAFAVSPHMASPTGNVTATAIRTGHPVGPAVVLMGAFTDSKASSAKTPKAAATAAAKKTLAITPAKTQATAGRIADRIRVSSPGESGNTRIAL